MRPHATTHTRLILALRPPPISERTRADDASNYVRGDRVDDSRALLEGVNAPRLGCLTRARARLRGCASLDSTKANEVLGPCLR